MKTPREILLGRHQAIEPKLDSLREQFVATLDGHSARDGAQKALNRTTSTPVSWRDLVLSFRWHLAGLAGMWLAIGLLRVTSGSAETPPVSQHQVASPRAVVLALRENRRQLLELGGAPTPSSPPVLQAVPQSRRSQLQVDWACA